MVSWGTYNSFGIFFLPVQTTFGWTRADTALATSYAQLATALAAVGTGWLTDKLGPRVVVAVLGSFLGIAYLLMSTVSSITQFHLYYGLIASIGLSTATAPIMATVARWFVKRRGFMTAVVKVGTGAGQVIMTIVAGVLITGYGWREACVVLAIIGIVGIVPIAQLLKHDPREMSLQPYGINEPNGTGPDYTSKVQLSIRDCIQTHQFWIVCAVYFLSGYATQGLMVHIVSYAMDSGITMVQAATITSVVGAVSIAGRLALGGAGDKIGNRRALIVCFVFLTISLCFLQFARGIWMLYLFALIYGFGHGGFFAVMSPMVAELFGTKHQGVNLGVVLFLQAAGSALGPLVTGYIFDITGSYQLAFLILIGVSAGPLALSIAITPVTLKEIESRLKVRPASF